MEEKKMYDILELQKKPISELYQIWENLKIENEPSGKQDLIYQILNEQYARTTQGAVPNR